MEQELRDTGLMDLGVMHKQLRDEGSKHKGLSIQNLAI